MTTKTKTKQKTEAEIRAEIEAAEAALNQIEMEKAEERRKAAEAEHKAQVERARAFLAGADEIKAALREESLRATEDRKTAAEAGDLGAYVDAVARWHAERDARQHLYYRIEDMRRFLGNSGEEIPNAGVKYPEMVRVVDFDGAKILAEFVEAAKKNRTPAIADDMLRAATEKITGAADPEEG